MMETLYWKMLDYLGGLSPEFVSIRNASALARFKKRHIHLLDSSTIQLVLNSIDWARHRAKKAAAKLHMNDLLGTPCRRSRSSKTPDITTPNGRKP